MQKTKDLFKIQVDFVQPVNVYICIFCKDTTSPELPEGLGPDPLKSWGTLPAAVLPFTRMCRSTWQIEPDTLLQPTRQ